MENIGQVIEEQISKFKPMVYARVNRTAAEDVLQEIRLAFLKSFPGFRGGCKLSTYSYRIVKRRIADYYRKEYRNAGYQRINKETKIHAGSKYLSTRENEIMKLVGYGFSNDEIAEYLDISINTVRTHMKKIHLKLQLGSRVKLALFSYQLFQEGGKKNEN